MHQTDPLNQLYNSLDQEYRNREKKLTPKIKEMEEQLTSWLLSNHKYHQMRDKTDLLKNQLKFIQPKDNFKVLLEKVANVKWETIKKTKSELIDILNDQGKLYHKIQAFVLHSPKGTLSLTSLYDSPKAAKRLLFDFNQRNEADLIEFTQMPDFVSITGILSGKGLGTGALKSRKVLTLQEIKDFAHQVKTLGLNIQMVATRRNKKGLPTISELKLFQQEILAYPDRFRKKGQRLSYNTQTNK